MGIARLTLAYDGTDFRGFAESSGVRTVMGELRATVERIVRAQIEPRGAGRTDAGVHGWGQVVSFELADDVDLGRLQHSCNRMLGPEIAVRSAQWAASGFDARFSATSRSYRYHVWNHPVPNPLRARTSWHVPTALDLGAMNDAAVVLVGEHDFSSFCRRPKPDGRSGDRSVSLVRRVLSAHWVDVTATAGDVGPATTGDEVGRLLRFDIAATAFCHQMVRSIVGTLVEVGAGRRAASSVIATLAARDRARAGHVAPPTGLVLWEVGYDGVRWDRAPGSDT